MSSIIVIVSFDINLDWLVLMLIAIPLNPGMYVPRRQPYQNGAKDGSESYSDDRAFLPHCSLQPK